MPSSVIEKFSYDTVEHTLQITFVSGKVYRYKAVPQNIYNNMKSSTSKGRYLNTYIRDLYDFEELDIT